MTDKRLSLNENSLDAFLKVETSTADSYQPIDKPVYTRKLSLQSYTSYDMDSLYSTPQIYFIDSLFSYQILDPATLLENMRPSRLRRRVYSSCENTPVEKSTQQKKAYGDILSKYKTEICKNFEFKGNCEWASSVR